MKKTSLLAPLAVVILLAGCGGSNPAPEASSAAESTTSVSASSANGSSEGATSEQPSASSREVVSSGVVAKADAVRGKINDVFKFEDLFDYAGDIVVTEIDAEDVLSVNNTTQHVILSKSGVASVKATQGDSTAAVQITVVETDLHVQAMKTVAAGLASSYYVEGVDMSSGATKSTQKVVKQNYEYDFREGEGYGVFPDGNVYKFRESTSGYKGYGTAKSKASWQNGRFQTFSVDDVSFKSRQGTFYVYPTKTGTTTTNPFASAILAQLGVSATAKYEAISINVTFVESVIVSATFFVFTDVAEDKAIAQFEVTFDPVGTEISAIESFLETAETPESGTVDKNALKDAFAKFINGTSYEIMGADHEEADGEMFYLAYNTDMFYEKDWLDDDRLGSGYVNMDGKVYRYDEYRDQEELGEPGKGQARLGSEVSGATDWKNLRYNLFTASPELFAAPKVDPDDGSLFTYDPSYDDYALAEYLVRTLGYDLGTKADGSEITNYGHGVESIQFEVNGNDIDVGIYFNGNGNYGGKILFRFYNLNAAELPVFVNPSEYDVTPFVGTWNASSPTGTLVLNADMTGTLHWEKDDGARDYTFTWDAAPNETMVTQILFTFSFTSGANDGETVTECYKYVDNAHNTKILNFKLKTTSGGSRVNWFQFRMAA